MSTAASRARRRVVALTLAVGALAVSALPSLAAPGAAGAGLGYRAAPMHAHNAAFRRHFYRGQHYHGAHHGNGLRFGRGLGYGAAAAAGVGLAGLAMGGAFVDDVAAGPGDPMEEAVAYCADRFKSYDPSTGTYTGYDGQAHACP